MENTQLDRPLEQNEALRKAADLCEATLPPASRPVAVWDARFRECLTLQVAGYLLRAGEHLPRPQWLASSLGMSTLELPIEGGKAPPRRGAGDYFFPTVTLGAPQTI